MRKTYGYRSVIVMLLTGVASGLFLGWLFGNLLIITIIAIILSTIFTNTDTFDARKITVTDDQLRVERFIKVTEFNYLFWLIDVDRAYIDNREISGTKYTTPIVVVLKNGTEHIINLPTMLSFERRMLQKQLDKVMSNTPKDDRVYNLSNKPTRL